VKTKLIPAVTIAIVMSAIIYTGCQKENDAPVPATTTSDRTISGIHEMAAADASFMDAVSMVSAGTVPGLINIEPNSTTPWTSPCAITTTGMHGIEHTATIDFGTGCIGNDGNLRSGRIMIVWQGNYAEKGFYYMISFDKYALNHNRIEGSAKVVNLGPGGHGYIEFQVDAAGAITVPPREPAGEEATVMQRTGETRMSYTFHGFREWVAGMLTDTWNDDIYLIHGGFYGTTLSGLSYKTDITTPLRHELSYPYYTSGIVNLRVNDALKIIDYGFENNKRDDLASVIVGDVMTVIHLNENPLMIVNIW